MSKSNSQIQKIYQFWQDKAKIYKTSPEASWGDLLMNKEVDVIDQNLDDGDKVLDVGCANGYSSIELAKRKKINLTGIDYSPSMIRQANKAKSKLDTSIKKRLSFKVGNVLKLDFPDNTFDKVNSTRCLCNLRSWKDQSRAIKEMWRVLKPRRTLLISEPTIQGLASLNKIGKKFRLKPLKAPWHNLYLDEKKLIKFTKPYFQLKINNFSSTYYLFSRVIYRWLMRDDATRLKRDSIFNKIGLRLPAVGDWGTQRLYILRKK